MLSDERFAPLAAVATTSPPAAASELLRLSWSHPPGMVALCFKNFLLRVVTIGFYQFWGKTEVRRRIWSAIRLNDEPLQYTGTGKEMLLGFLFIFAVLLIPTTLISFAIVMISGVGSRLLEAFQFITMLTFLYLTGVGTHRAIRYRLSRTRWRGIRFGLDGSAWNYGSWYFWTGLLLVLTLGWISPWRSTKLQNLITNKMRFGDRPFQFDAMSGPLYRPFAVLWLVGFVIVAAVGAALYSMFGGPGGLASLGEPGKPPNPAVLFKFIAIVYGAIIVGFLLFGIVSAWYRAQMMNHFAAHTTFEGARFSANATGRSLIWLTISNTLMVIFTLGLLAPLAQVRAARYFVQRMQINGGAALAEIIQRAEDQASRGEGLAQAFDIDAF